jgi:hypothetical protein
MADRKWKMSRAVVVGALLLSPVASKAQTGSKVPEPECDARTGNLLGFEYLVKPGGATGLPNFDLMVRGAASRPNDYDYKITPLTKEDKETIVGRQSVVEGIIDTAIEAAKNYCRAKIAKEGQQTFRPDQVRNVAARAQRSPAA